MRWQVSRSPLALALAVLALLSAPLHAAHAHNSRGHSAAAIHHDGSAAPLVDLTYTSPSAVEHPHHAGGHDCAFDKITRAVHREPLPDGASGPRRRLSELGLAQTHQNYGNVEDEHGRRLQSTTYRKLRLVVDTSLLEANADSFACSAAGQTIQYTLAGSSNDPYVCKAEDVLTAAKRAFIRDTLIPAAVDFLTASLSVIPVSGNLINSSPLPDGSCFNDGLGYWYSLVCCARFWPTRFSSPGVANADFLLVLSARPTRGNLLAWATECQSDQYFRPISGQANLSPAKVSTDASAFQFQLSVILHEICHAIGFNQDKLFNFRQPGSLSQPAPYSSVVFSGFDPLLQKDVTKVISPKVVAAAKAHYGCYSDWINPGMELEDGGAGGTRGSHWEKRLAMYELMNGVSELAMYRSSLTLAFFEDSGWYSVDYSRSETLPWGNGEGCNFVAKRCNNWDSRYFCSVQGQIGCTSDARFQAFCTYSQDSLSRPSSFQYFDSPQKGGTSDIPDYCPFYQAYSNRDCQNSATTAYFFYGESPGTFSKCFHGTYQLASTVTTLQRHAGCLRYRCGPANSLIAILGFNSGFQLEVPCPKAGGDVDVSALPGSQWAGTLNCPRSDVICTGDACALNPTCDGHGVCDKLNGTCSCAAGFYGSTTFSCDLRKCPTATPGQDCSGHGVCNPQQGYCMKDATAGRPGCATGYTGDDCSARGCPTDANGLSCSGPTRGTCNNQTAVCSCLPGFVGEACEFKECPSLNGALCGGTTRGDCDGDTGICDCKTSVNTVTGNATSYYGADCGTEVNGDRAYIPLSFLGTKFPVPGPNGTTVDAVVYPTQGVFKPKEYQYYRFTVASTDKVTLRVEIMNYTGVQNGLQPFAYSSYSDLGATPTRRNKQFAGATVSTTATELVYENSPYDRGGTLLISTVSNADFPFLYNISIKRDNCLPGRTCIFGICRDGECVCQAPDRLGGMTAGWTGTRCDIPDCYGTPDCGGRGRCDKTNAYAAGGAFIPGASPQCKCDSLYTGFACQQVNVESGSGAGTRPTFNLVPAPGASDVKVGSFSPAVGTDARYKAGSAMLVTNTTSLVTVMNQTITGTVKIGANITVLALEPASLKAYFNGSLGFYARLDFSNSRNADGLMLGAENFFPDLLKVGEASMEFDAASWRKRSITQEFSRRIANSDSSTIYFVRMFNGKYGQEDLQYTFYYEVSSGTCPPAYRGCSNRGTCDVATMKCNCDPGYFGMRCESRLTTLPSVPVASAMAQDMVPGTWSFFNLEVLPGDVQIGLTFTPTDQSGAGARGIMTAAYHSSRSLSNLNPLELITSESAFFDYAGASAAAATALGAASNASLTPQKLLLRRQAGGVMLYLGVHNSASAKGILTGKLEVVRYNATATPVCADGDQECAKAACYGHGTYRFVSGKPECACDRGWTDIADCAAPSFQSLAQIVKAAQSVGTLCSLCGKSDTVTAGSMQIFSVPQTLQKSTALQLSLQTANASRTGRRQLQIIFNNNTNTNGGSSNIGSTLADVALLVADQLPRSIIDFSVILSGASSSFSSLLTSSSSGKFFATVYAHTSGNYSLAAQRKLVDVDVAIQPSFAAELASWLVNTKAGQAVLGCGVTLGVLIIAACILQGVTTTSVEKRIDRAQRQARRQTLAFISNQAKLTDALKKNAEAFADKPALRQLSARRGEGSNRRLDLTVANAVTTQIPKALGRTLSASRGGLLGASSTSTTPATGAAGSGPAGLRTNSRSVSPASGGGGSGGGAGLRQASAGRRVMLSSGNTPGTSSAAGVLRVPSARRGMSPGAPGGAAAEPSAPPPAYGASAYPSHYGTHFAPMRMASTGPAPATSPGFADMPIGGEGQPKRSSIFAGSNPMVAGGGGGGGGPSPGSRPLPSPSAATLQAASAAAAASAVAASTLGSPDIHISRSGGGGSMRNLSPVASSSSPAAAAASSSSGGGSSLLAMSSSANNSSMRGISPASRHAGGPAIVMEI